MFFISTLVFKKTIPHSLIGSLYECNFFLSESQHLNKDTSPQDLSIHKFAKPVNILSYNPFGFPAPPLLSPGLL